MASSNAAPPQGQRSYSFSFDTEPATSCPLNFFPSLCTSVSPRNSGCFVLPSFSGCSNCSFYFIFLKQALLSLSWPGTSYAAEDDLECLILLPPPHECWDPGVHHQAIYAVLGNEPRALCILGMRYTS